MKRNVVNAVYESWVTRRLTGNFVSEEVGACTPGGQKCPAEFEMEPDQLIALCSISYLHRVFGNHLMYANDCNWLTAKSYVLQATYLFDN